MRIELGVRDADGRCRQVAIRADASASWSEVAREVAAATGVLPRFSGWRRLSASQRPGQPGLLRGELLSPGRVDALAAPHRAARRLHVIGGPCAGRIVELPAGRLLIGRDPDCDLVLADPEVSRRHAEIDAGEREIRIRDLRSAHGTQLAGRAVTAAGEAILPGQLIRLGQSLITVAVDRGEPAAIRSSGDGTLLLRRTPVSSPSAEAECIELPSAPSVAPATRIQLAAGLMPAAAGILVALVLRSPAFLLFALLTPLGMLFGALGDRLHRRRARRREAALFGAELAAARAELRTRLRLERARRRARYPDAAAVLHLVSNRTRRIWERAGGDPELLRVRVGTADLPSRLRVRSDGPGMPGTAMTLHAVPATVDLADGPLGLLGPRQVATGIARHLLTQLAALCSPTEVRIALLLDRTTEADWRWARWLPHLDLVDVDEAAAAEAISALLARHPRTVLLVDAADPLTAVPRLAETPGAGARPGLFAIIVAVRPAQLPAACTSVARSADECGCLIELTSPARADQPARVRLVADLVDADYGDRIARALAPLSDARAPAAGLPTRCRLLDLLALPEPTADGVLSRWRLAAAGATFILGAGEGGPLTIDLARDGPHVLVAGTTGSGKSELLRTMVAALAATHPPSAVSFVLIDYKGGAAFAECADLPHTVGVVTDLDAALTRRALRSLHSELHRREALFAAAAVRDFTEYRAEAEVEPLARLVVVVDEFAALAEQLPDFVRGLVEVAQRGRSLGVHLVLATQRPAGAVTGEIRANAALRIALRTIDDVDSREVLDAPDAAALDPAVPGQAVLRHGSLLRRMQTATVGTSAPSGRQVAVAVDLLDEWLRPPDGAARPPAPGPERSDLTRLVEAIRAAAVRLRLPPAHRPWLPPLPDTLSLGGLPRTRRGSQLAIGLIDDPAAQAQPPFTLDLDGGCLLLAGAPRSGRSATLLAIATAAAARFGPDELHLYAIDTARGLSAVADLPHCGTRAHTEDFRVVATLLQRLAVSAAGGQDPEPRPRRLLLVDGWEAFQAAADDFDGGRSVDALLTLSRAAPSVGMTVVISGDRGALTGRPAGSAQTRLALRLNDPADYALLGISPRDVPSTMPPGRAIRAGDGAHIQLARPDDGAPRPAGRCGRGTGAAPPIRVRALPRSVGLAEIGDGPGIALGVGGDAAEPIRIALAGGGPGRFLVAGPPRSGRSNALRLIVLQARAAGTEVVVAAPDHSPLAALARAAGCLLILPSERSCRPPERALLVVDDGSAFQDTVGGELLADWMRRRPGTAVVAATSDEVAVAFRGPVAEARRARCGLLLAPTPADAALLDVALPYLDRRPPAGRGVLVPDPAWGLAEGPLPIQVALAAP